MDNFANNYMKEFSQRAKDFPTFFNQWWIYKSILDKSIFDAKGIDIAYWFFMQDFAQKQFNQFADELPERGKEVIDDIKKAC